ncbi:MAG: efflux transporter, family, subunit [Bacteroidota bacterium]|nr:efflux transporter, family, subunit [Bacteroidota bacterium]
MIHSLSKKTFLAVTTSLVLLSSCHNNNTSAPHYDPNAAVDVVVQPVTAQVVSYFDQYPGTITALNQVDLRPQVSGYITAVYFSDGDRVAKGQKLYSIDAQLYSANYEQAIANLQVQESNLDKAQKDADRYHELEKKDAVAKQQVDYANSARDVAQKQVEAAKANVRSLQTGVKYTTITAPFSGTIGISQVKTGTAVTAGQTILNTVSTDDPMAVDFSVDQKEIYRFSKLQQNAKGSDSTFRIAFNENEVYPYPGQIDLLDRAVDPQTGTLKVRLKFSNKQNLLRSGMTCNVRVLNSDHSPVILVPHKAVTEQLGEFFIYVASGNKVSQRKVIPGTAIGENIIIKEGLKENELIVIEGVQKLHEGSVIKTGNAAAPAKK